MSFDLNPLKKDTGSYTSSISKPTEENPVAVPYDFYLNVCDKVRGTNCDETTDPGPGACQQEKDPEK